MTTGTRRDGFPEAATAEDIARNLTAVRARIAAACNRSGRDPARVRLLPVSKTVEERRVRMAYDAGLTAFGENKVQEARRKAQATSDLGIAWAVIGHLQTNKAKYVARFASEFQALDSLRLAEALERRLEIEDRTIDVHVQVNTSGEESKYGLGPDAALGFARELPAFSRLQVRGLMTLAILSGETERVRRCFRVLGDVQARLRQDGPGELDVSDLSMGMSSDFETAIEEGATTVRVGQAIFGPRPLPDSHYWPSTKA